jgi:catalase
MAVANPVGRVNYEPNSWDGGAGGPREDPDAGFRSYDPSAEPGAVGPKQRVRSETFADHYSQARQFYVSQTDVEQRHIADSFTFELSKVEQPEIRARMVANLRNVDEELAAAVAEGLALPELPPRSTPAREPIADLPESPALSILLNGPESVEGRKFGLLVTDGTDAGLLAELVDAISSAGATYELVAPRVGVELDDGNLTPAHQRIDGGPSVLYDAVAILASEPFAAILSQDSAAKDFVSDAYAHCKFIGYTDGAAPLFAAAGLDLDVAPVSRDDGVIGLDAVPGAGFVAMCRNIRFWERIHVPVS